MAMIYCKKCGKEITDNCTRCPNCGEPNNIDKEKEGNTSTAIIAIIFFIIIGIGLFTFLDNMEETNTNPEKEVNITDLSKYDMKVDIAEFTETYYKNELTGNKKYGNKRIKIKGKLNNIDVDDSIILNTGTTCYLNSGKHYDVACNFEKGDTSNLSDYSRGEYLTIIGTVDGLHNGFPNKIIYLKECIVVDN